MTQQQLDAAVQLSNRISEIKRLLLAFDKGFTLDGTGTIVLHSNGTFLDSFDLKNGMPKFAEQFLADYRRHLAAQLKAAEMEFENI
jgi:hypothetical protein